MGVQCTVFGSYYPLSAVASPLKPSPEKGSPSFMKTMPDERGEMVLNAHLLGFFRQICKLLYLRTKPVLVFNGGTPALKRRTLIARRSQRDNAQAKV